jgi:hypothetical protein
MLPKNDLLKVELENLEQNRATGKIDHRAGFSKDLADCVAGVVYQFSSLKRSYLMNEISNLNALSISNTSRPSAVDRPSSGRDSLYA